MPTNRGVTASPNFAELPKTPSTFPLFGSRTFAVIIGYAVGWTTAVASPQTSIEAAMTTKAGSTEPNASDGLAAPIHGASANRR